MSSSSSSSALFITHRGEVAFGDAIYKVVLLTLVIWLIFLTGTPTNLNTVTLGASAVHDANNCPPRNVCEAGFFAADISSCEYTPLPTGETCIGAACYIEDANTTACTSAGQCEGNTTECRGYCRVDSDCNGTIPIAPFWLTQVADWEDDGMILAAYRYMCWYNRCELHLLDRFMNNLDNDFPEGIGMWSRCEDYLTGAFLASQGGCLTTQRFLIDHNVSATLYPVNATDQFSMCSYYYDCAPLNQTAIELDNVIESSSGGGGAHISNTVYIEEHMHDVALTLFDDVVV